ncbi:MAG TPA: cupin domain-containing protein [Chloroflexota bacterium]|nr:cupin domain-containing protein [Chloroflexota bacterium]
MPVVIEPARAQRFQMGGGDSRRLVGPDVGARSVSMNFSVFQPGHEFPQHVHDASADVFIVLDGGVSVRQGDAYTPIKAGDLAYIPPGEVHGTVNLTDGVATLISFQSPPDDALYRGERDSSRNGAAPKPPPGHTSRVKIGNLTATAPTARPGVRAWTPVGAAELRISCYVLDPGATLDLPAADGERVVFVTEGSAALEHGAATAAALPRWTGAFLAARESGRLRNDGPNPTQVIECRPAARQTV